jgi:hypothetical protein
MTLIAKFVLMILAVCFGVISGHLYESGYKSESCAVDMIAVALGTLAILLR